MQRQQPLKMCWIRRGCAYYAARIVSRLSSRIAKARTVPQPTIIIIIIYLVRRYRLRMREHPHPAYSNEFKTKHSQHATDHLPNLRPSAATDASPPQSLYWVWKKRIFTALQLTCAPHESLVFASRASLLIINTPTTSFSRQARF